MKRRSMLFAAALAAMSLFGSVAHAGSISVTSDSGTLGSFTLTNTGISGGVSTLVLSLTSPATETLQTINGAPVTIPAAFVSPITLKVMPMGGGAYMIALTPPTYTKTFGTGAASATLAYDLTAGQTAFAGTFFNLTGAITSLVTDALPGYTFAPFLGGGGFNDITLVARTFGGGASSFDTVVSTVGGHATGNGSFSESAVPEPASLALLGIGISGLLTFRRFFKRISVA